MSERAIEVLNWRAVSSTGSLRGFFTVVLPSGMRIHDCSLFEKDGQRWVNGPLNSFTSNNGKTTRKRLVEFVDKNTAGRFSAAVLSALDAHLGTGQ